MFEAYNLLQEGKTEQAEQLVADGIHTTRGMHTPEHLGLAQLRDQLALLKFVRGDLHKAEDCARSSLEWTVKSFTEDAPIVAMCQLRLGSILVAVQRYDDALPLLKSAKATLEGNLGKEYPAAAEARFYIALAHAANPFLEAEKQEIQEQMSQSLVGMRKQEGAGSALVNTGLREHHRLVEAALAARDWAKARALYVQEVALHEAVSPGSQSLAQVTYQHSTLLYVLGHLEEARQACQQSMDLCTQLYRSDDDHVFLRMHRMGTICVAESNFESATNFLSDAEQHFHKHLGPKDPLTGEAQLCLSIARVKVMDSSHGRVTALKLSKVHDGGARRRASPGELIRRCRKRHINAEAFRFQLRGLRSLRVRAHRLALLG
ncbi:hypothetical protein WJX73_000212 [Symbiochloris irregularis]|uniref:MalT-like TPR region domain-containing protein n=1 Tax=Symbiochloris irregularis TaxID=706552 RepID=A0AAW1PCI9_9CHLO